MITNDRKIQPAIITLYLFVMAESSDSARLSGLTGPDPAYSLLVKQCDQTK